MTLITIDRPAIEQVLESLLELVPDPRTDFGPAYGGASQRRKKSISILRAALLVKHSAKQPAEQQEPDGTVPLEWYLRDEALLRQALDALDWIVTGRGHDTIETAHAAIRTRLGETK